LKQQTNKLDEEILLDRHRKQQGMDFINVRKEISSELRTMGIKMKKYLKMPRQDMSKTSFRNTQLRNKAGNTLNEKYIPQRFNQIFSPSDNGVNLNHIVDG